MKAVWKFPLGIADFQSIEMPKGAEVLTVQVQRGAPYVWVRVDPLSPKVEHIIAVAGTGHNREVEMGRYVGTFQMSDGDLVFHVFDGGEV